MFPLTYDHQRVFRRCRGGWSVISGALVAPVQRVAAGRPGVAGGLGAAAWVGKMTFNALRLGRRACVGR